MCSPICALSSLFPPVSPVCVCGRCFPRVFRILDHTCPFAVPLSSLCRRFVLDSSVVCPFFVTRETQASLRKQLARFVTTQSNAREHGGIACRCVSGWFCSLLLVPATLWYILPLGTRPRNQQQPSLNSPHGIVLKAPEKTPEIAQSKTTISRWLSPVLSAVFSPPP